MRHASDRVRCCLLALTTILLSVLPRPAAAVDDVYLHWNQCGAAGGTSNRDFACDVDTGSELLVLTFRLDQPMIQPLRFEAVIEAVHSGFIGIVDPFGQPPPTYPVIRPWWRTGAGQCHAGGAVGSADFSVQPFGSTPECLTGWVDVEPVWATQTVWPVAGDSTRVRWNLVGEPFVGYPAGNSIPADTELYAFTLALRHTRSTGAGACDGCCVKTVIAVRELRLISPVDGSVKAIIPQSLDSVVSWQFGNAACEVVPARPSTWGELKTRYR